MAKIYTKVGDGGQTSLVSGTKISKGDVRLEAYGTVDELNSCLGVARAEIKQIKGHTKERKQMELWLAKIQNDLFNLGSLLACEKAEIAKKLPSISESQIKEMESQIDQMTKVLKPLREFILPGGHSLAASLHVCRTVCRRAERWTVRLSKESDNIDPVTIKYLNRLSDFLFTIARYGNHLTKTPEPTWEK
ncbi:MAG: cob(I)yrinic acid a,c-diamide adenosyltransferase [Bdellovibrionales bacterium]